MIRSAIRIGGILTRLAEITVIGSHSIRPITIINTVYRRKNAGNTTIIILK